jgi:hypothetical protein
MCPIRQTFYFVTKGIRDKERFRGSNERTVMQSYKSYLVEPRVMVQKIELQGLITRTVISKEKHRAMS